MTDEPETPSLQERMAAVARGETPGLAGIDAARAHLGTALLEDAAEAMARDGKVLVHATVNTATGEIESEVVLDPADRGLPPHDAETGEIIEEPQHADLERETYDRMKHDPEPIRVAAETPKAEVIEQERAADGHPAPFAARDTGQLINMLENGQFSADVIAAMTALAAGMSEISEATGKRQKGTLTIKINLTTENDAFFMEGDFTVKAPKLPRPRTLAWRDEKGYLSPSQPRQRVFFGVKDVGRELTDARVIRTA